MQLGLFHAGLEVVAVELSGAMRDEAQRLHPSASTVDLGYPAKLRQDFPPRSVFGPDPVKRAGKMTAMREFAVSADEAWPRHHHKPAGALNVRSLRATRLFKSHQLRIARARSCSAMRGYCQCGSRPVPLLL
jgi:hypothetical protein